MRPGGAEPGLTPGAWNPSPVLRASQASLPGQHDAGQTWGRSGWMGSEISRLHLVRAAPSQACTVHVRVCTCTHTYGGASHVPHTRARPSRPPGRGRGVRGPRLRPTSSGLKGGGANSRRQSPALSCGRPAEGACRGFCTRPWNSTGQAATGRGWGRPPSRGHAPLAQDRAGAPSRTRGVETVSRYPDSFPPFSTCEACVSTCSRQTGTPDLK